jgi:starch synthase (maltosyl-transferring)
VREASEEYLDSEKYEIKQRALDGPLLPLIKRVNEIRRSNPALHHLSNVTFLDTANDALMAYAKQTGTNIVVTVVNLDPHQTQEGLAVVPAHLGMAPSFTVTDLLTGERFQWRIGPNYVRLEPGTRQAHINLIET